MLQSRNLLVLECKFIFVFFFICSYLTINYFPFSNEVVQHLSAIDNLSHSVQTLIPWSVLVWVAIYHFSVWKDWLSLIYFSSEIDNGKNPANLTRQHVERVSSENMWMNGKVDAILVCRWNKLDNLQSFFYLFWYYVSCSHIKAG